MKKLCAVLAALIAAVILCSCSGGGEKKESSVPLSQVFEKIKSQVEIKDFNEFNNAKSLDRFYGLTDNDFEEYAGGINSSGVNQEEIVLIKAKDEAAAARVKEALDTRYASKVAQNKNYNPQQAAMVEKCSVEKNGLYVTMIVSPNAEKITTIFKSELNL
ncbi:MAG TPA: hypothetical protein DEO32_03890 [Ruminococcaceae bacterium]|nr:hypothetical protein [Oscillospiraceae bacterium]